MPGSGTQQMTPVGGITIYNAGELKAQLLQRLEETELLELDLSRVDELDSAGLQVLVLAKREAQRCQRHLAIVAHSAEVQEVFDLLGLARWFGDPMLMHADSHRAAAAREA
ncbi:STAS domain-containing protein [Uliginosibacterium sp. 31-12]|uniref:STAS domain-containing protein n=1 Tax=Uliginosibacterium sp. 31-12 TaxID=3062781 RepID=UPI0026E2CD45|nr:STAS domain-containing protein [Uliginosibacterium sp. 31-12]MDO6385828.1 STAS domain-containing protein [Uliginosibacterium sp. 31-12]